MQTLSVNLGERSYPILIGPGLLSSPTVLAGHIPASDVLLISNTVVAPLYAERVKRGLHGRRLIEVILPDGEAHKTLASANRVFDVLIANRFGRDGVIVALGGGVIGDLAGFAAACYQRGIDCV
ncbi:MAG TPA: 3-dehydroquinate synthase, partial [Steroidobacteraceae bacterium]|nr:3-dehydroquinate synthase [Steroidobacteraceae bacterium]